MSSPMDIVRRMTRRIIATALWAYFGWFLAATVLSLLGLPTAISLLAGLSPALRMILLRSRA